MLQSAASPPHLHPCQVLVAVQTVVGVGAEEVLSDLLLILLVGDQEVEVAKVVEAVTYLGLQQQALGALEVEVEEAKMQVYWNCPLNPILQSLAMVEAVVAEVVQLKKHHSILCLRRKPRHQQTREFWVLQARRISNEKRGKIQREEGILKPLLRN